jgi:hypothetical protein
MKKILPNAMPKPTQEEPKTSAADILLQGIDEAVVAVNQILQSSFDVREQFQSQWDAALSSYQMYIGRIEEEYEQIMMDQKRRRKALDGQSRGSETNHALKFYMASKREPSVNDGSDVFILPSDDNDYFQLMELPDDGSQSCASSVSRSNCATNKKPESKALRKTAEQIRFDSRSTLLSKIDYFRAEEATLLKKLADAQPQDDGMNAALTCRERQDLEDELEQCRIKQAHQIVSTVNEYKPKLRRADKKSASSDINNVQPIVHILDADVTDTASNPSLNSKSEKSRRVSNEPRQFSGPYKIHARTKTTTASKPSVKNKSLLLNYTNSRKTEQHVIRDSDNFLAVHELTPSNRSLQRQEKRVGILDSCDDKCCQSHDSAYYDDDTFDEETEPINALYTLVKCNTRPLNPLELGRRNRVGRDRRSTVS